MSEEEKEHAEDLTAGSAGGSSAPDVRHAEEDLPPELKAIEAELASLRPRTDRLDRERLIFLVGQQSACTDTKGRSGWAWPAAFSAMTAVAASLLVMLIAQGEPRAEVRIVNVPVERAGNGETVSDPNVATPPAEGLRIERLPDWAKPSREPVPRPGLLALVGLDWMPPHDRGPHGSETSYPRLLDQLLREGIDSWPSPAPVVSTEHASGPVGYRELLNKELGRPAPNGPLPERPLMHTLFYPGANS